MRILAIRGRNLASLEGTFEVELDRAPLNQAGLFAITGPTGAGKSTLLDAICLALFDQMPRLPKGGVAVGRLDDPERLKSGDVCSVLRRGCAEGFAEVDFVGGDGRVYRARWQARRARGKAHGKLQPQEISLTELLSGQTLGRTKTEVLDAIAQRLGLTFEQFRRSVLLAQGDFAAFLKAEPRQRSELLERITGTDIYSELSIAAHQREKEERTELESLAQRLGGVRPLDEAERQTLERRRADHQREHDRAELEKQAAQRVIDWHGRLAELVRREQEAVIDRATAQREWDAAEPRRREVRAVEEAQTLRSLVEAWEGLEQDHARLENALEESRTAAGKAEATWQSAERGHQVARTALERASAALESIRPALQQARILDQQITDAAGRLERIEHDSAIAARESRQAERRWQALQAEHKQVLARHDETAAWLARNAKLAELAQQWARWRNEFDRHGQADETARHAREALQTLAARIAEQERHLNETDERLMAAQAAADRFQVELQNWENATATADLETLRQSRVDLDARRQRLRDLHARAVEAQAKNQELAQVRATIMEAEQRAANANREAAAKAQDHDRLQVALDEAERARQLALAAGAKDARKLRALLRDGEPCPVCGARDHPWTEEAAPDAPVAQWAREQELRVKELQRQLHEFAVERGRLQTERDHAERQAREATTRAATLSAELAALAKVWADRPADEDLVDDPLAASSVDTVADRLHGVETELKTLAAAERAALEHQQKVSKARARFDEERTRRDALQQTRAELHQTIHRLNAEQAGHRVALHGAEQAQRESTEQLAVPLASVTDWREALAADPGALRHRCEQEAQRWRKHQEDLDGLAKRLQELHASEKEVAAEMRNAGTRAAERAAERHAQEQQLSQQRQQRQALLEGQSADAVEQAGVEAEAGARAAVEHTRRDLDEARSQHVTAAARVTHGQTEWSQVQTARANARQRLDDALVSRGIDLAVLRRWLGHDAAWLARERTALRELEARGERAQALLAERRQQRERQQTDNPPATSIEEARAALERARTASDAAHTAWVEISSRLKQDDANRQQAARLHQDHAAQRRRWELWESLRELIGSADGGKFRTYAQSLTLDVLLTHANRHLTDLARRYRLERVPGSDLELQVIDREMGDEVRSVHSLSGGESFLVSLALALGLASLSSRRTRIESMFIDEGFGSLDPDTLDVAIAALDALQSQGCQVGVISHVPAMVERIGTQVRVEARGGGRSVVRTVTAH